MKEKDKEFLHKALGIDDCEFDKLVAKVRELPEDGDDCKENYVKGLIKDMPGREAYEVKKILLTRLD
ncbi:MAG: hypothetical protein M0R46_09825 [Candidatus Muirbacterium halophilum]|nr:hypothetical protein [Candidatus Muirbacterium halophilum]MCK9476208.1 hypothetical protein [Candidatus Muirbacterium halophilum]